MEHFDLIVIGAGPAGEKAAAKASYFGKKVALIELAQNPGGAGVHTVPYLQDFKGNRVISFGEK